MTPVFCYRNEDKDDAEKYQKQALQLPEKVHSNNSPKMFDA